MVRTLSNDLKNKVEFMKKINIIIWVLSLIFLFSCTDDDWVKYTNNTYNVSVDLNDDVYNIVDLESQLDKIVYDYTKLKDLNLVYVKYHMGNGKNDKSDTIYLQYLGEYVKNDAGFANTIDFYIDIQEKKVNKIISTDGIAKRVSALSSTPLTYDDENVFNSYEKYVADLNDKKIEFDYIEIVLCKDEIITRYYNNP